MLNLFSSFWVLFVLIIVIILHKPILRLLFGMVIVPEDKIGLVTKKFVLFGVNKALPDGRILATKGEAGFQAKTLAPGLYFWMWVWQYEVNMTNFTVIPEGKIGCRKIPYQWWTARTSNGLYNCRILPNKYFIV